MTVSQPLPHQTVQSWELRSWCPGRPSHSGWMDGEDAGRLSGLVTMPLFHCGGTAFLSSSQPCLLLTTFCLVLFLPCVSLTYLLTHSVCLTLSFPEKRTWLVTISWHSCHITSILAIWKIIHIYPQIEGQQGHYLCIQSFYNAAIASTFAVTLPLPHYCF